MAYERTSGAGGSGKWDKYDPTHNGGGSLFEWAQNQREETNKLYGKKPQATPTYAAPVSNPYLDMLNAQKAEQERRRQEQIDALARRKQEQLEALNKRKQEQTAYLTGQKTQQLDAATQKYNELLSFLDKSYGQGNERLTGEKTNALQGAYVENEVAKRDMAQMNAAMGNTGGMSESAVVGQNAAYQTGRNNTDEHYGNLLKDLLMQTDEAKANAKMGYTDMANSIEQNIANAIMNVENQTFENAYNAESQAFDKTFEINSAYDDMLSKIETEYARQEAARKAAKSQAAPTERQVAKINNGNAVQASDTAQSNSGYSQNAGANTDARYKEGKIQDNIKKLARILMMEGAQEEEIIFAAKQEGLI